MPGLCTGCAYIVAELVEWLHGAHRPNWAALRRELNTSLGETRVSLTPAGRKYLAARK